MLADRLRPYAEALWLAALLAVFSAMLVHKAYVGGITVDEPAHLASSYCYWTTGETIPPRDMPPLIRLVGGWTTLFTGIPLTSSDCLQHPPRNEWDIAATLATRMTAAQAESIFTTARLPLILFPIGCLFICWLWMRQTYGPLAAAGTALLILLSPTIRGHGAVFKNDEAAAFAYLLFFFTLAKYWSAPGWKPMFFLAAAVGLCVAAKYSLLIVLPIAIATVIFRSRGKRWLHLAVFLAISYGAICVWFLPELGWISPEQRRAFRAMDGLPGWFVVLTAVGKVLPVPLPAVDGVAALLVSNHFASPVYLLGDYYPNGHPAYFLLLLLVKLPIPMLILLALAGGRIAWGLWRRETPPVLIWLIPATLYIAAASASNLQLGVRLILPALPLLYMTCGESLAWLWTRSRLRPVAAVAVLWMAFQTSRTFPNGISFMNLSVSSEQAIHLFSDSNLDWGQALPELAEYAHKQDLRHLYVAYFGFDNPHFYFKDEEITRIPMPWTFELAGGKKVYEPSPGVYAVSLNALTGQHFPPDLRGYFSRFRARRPHAVIENSIFIYIF